MGCNGKRSGYYGRRQEHGLNARGIKTKDTDHLSMEASRFLEQSKKFQTDRMISRLEGVIRRRNMSEWCEIKVDSNGVPYILCEIAPWDRENLIFSELDEIAEIENIRYEIDGDGDLKWYLKASGVDRGIGITKPMLRDERNSWNSYNQSAIRYRKDHPEYAAILHQMALDEVRHTRYLKKMDKGQHITIRDVLTDDTDQILDEMQKRNQITQSQRKWAEQTAQSYIEDVPLRKGRAERLRARGIEVALVEGLVSALASGLYKEGKK